MADIGINGPAPPKDPALAALHAEEQYHECRARIAGLKKTILAQRQDITAKEREIERAETEIRRLEAHLKTIPRPDAEE